MKNFKKLIFGIAIFICHPASAQLYSWHSIPERQIILNELYPAIESSHDIKITVKKFELSHEQVSLASYKIFLKDVLKDSGELVYQSLLPDTNIGPKKIRDEYFNSGKYDSYPVVGISWDNALRYCKWLTLKNNPDSLQVIYRLPNLYEYYSAYTYMQSSAIHNSLNNLYADWLMDAKDESIMDFQKQIPLAYYYFHLADDFPAQKRKTVIGSSFLYEYNEMGAYTMDDYYAYEGYSHIGFRIIKDTNKDSFIVTNEIDYKHDGTYFYYENPLLQYWNLIPKNK